MNFLDPRLPDRFWSKCTPEPNSGCWLWHAASQKGGYGTVNYRGQMFLAHRMTFAAVVGPLPPKSSGMTVDHRCNTTCCVNPQHLRLMDSGENTLRGESPSAKHARQTHCINGHAFDETNTIFWTSSRGHTQRLCRACRAAASIRANARRTAAHRYSRPDNHPGLRVGQAAFNAAKTHCIHGHLFDEKNTGSAKTRNGTRRVCRACDAAKHRARNVAALSDAGAE